MKTVEVVTSSALSAAADLTVWVREEGTTCPTGKDFNVSHVLRVDQSNLNNPLSPLKSEKSKVMFIFRHFNRPAAQEKVCPPTQHSLQ